MKTNLSGVIVSVRADGEFVPYCYYARISEFIFYLQKNGKINIKDDYDYSDFLKFLAQIEE